MCLIDCNCFICGLDALSEVPHRGLRPLSTNSEKKYLSRSVRLSNNDITDLVGLQFMLSGFLAQPSQLGWLDLSFNKITLVDSVRLSLLLCFLCTHTLVRLLLYFVTFLFFLSVFIGNFSKSSEWTYIQ